MSWEIFLLPSLENIITVLLPVLSIVLEDIINALRKKKGIRGIRIGKEEIKVLSGGNMIIYI